MAKAVQVRKSDDIVIGTWSGAGDIPVTPPESTEYFEEVTVAEYEELTSKGLFYPGGIPRWQVVGGPGGTLTEIADPRVLIGFFEPGTLVQLTSLERLVGQVPPYSIDVNAMIDASTIDSSFDGDVDLRLSDSRWVRVTLTNGQGNLVIKTDEAREWSIPVSQAGWNILNQLEVRILADGSA